MSKFIAAFSVALLCNNIASAGDAHQAAASAATPASFVSLDANGDHRISRTEAGVDRALSNHFAYVDKDGDGFINQSEFAGRQRNSRDPS